MKILYPLETKKRELDGALCLAAELIKGGHEVFLGPKRELKFKLDVLKPNLFIGSNGSYSSSNLKRFKYIVDTGCKIAIIDTEGGVIIDEIYKKRHDKRMLNYCEHFFAWGQKGKELLHEGTKYPLEKITASGVPWFDVLTIKGVIPKIYSQEIESIQKEYSSGFILYNSRFSGPNTYNKEVKKDFSNNLSKNERFHYTNNLFEKINNSIRVVAENFSDHKLIIRPHPSENKDFYLNQFSDLPNVYVDDRFNVRPWIYLSSLMFHNGCTTAIESSLMNKPTIAIQEIENNQFDVHLPNDISIIVKNNESLVSMINKLIKGDESYFLNNVQKESLNRYIANITQKASPIIAETINNIEPNNIQSKFNVGYKKEKIKKYIALNHIGLLKLVSRNKFNTVKSFKEYDFHKFPFLEKSEVESGLKKFTGMDFAIENVKGTKNSFSIKKI